MAPIRLAVKSSLVIAVLAGLLSLGLAGLAGDTPAGAAPAATHPVTCAKVRAHLARMHRRQATLAAKVLKLEASGARAARAGKAHRAAAFRRSLAQWRRIQARIINAKFLQKEEKLAAQVAGSCRAATSSVGSPTGTAIA